MDGRCKDCKHWERETVFVSMPNFGSCDHEANGMEVEDGFGSFVFGDSYPDSLADVITGPEFGCVHFEQKT